MFSHVLKANPYRALDGTYTTKDKAVTTTTIEQDLTAQEKWLSEQAKARGKQA